MKLIILVITSLIYSASADLSLDAPFCDTQEHLKQIYLRNVQDPTKFWGCFEFNKRAEQFTCPTEQGFYEPEGKCINWDDWRWTEPNAQPKALSWARAKYTEGHDGRPGCSTSIELTRIYWRNNNDPTKYWKCEEPNKPGVEMRCPEGYAYISAVEICIPLDRWEWSEPADPPSLA